MKLSIIIPAFNVEKYLPKCLDSILQQGCTDFEVVVVNDGSTDGTRVLLDQYAAKYGNLKVITQANAGMSIARNRGLDEAQGEYVMFVDSDDWLFEDSLTQLAQELQGEDVVCFGAQKYIESSTAYIPNNRPINNETVSGWEYFNKQRLLPTEIHFVCIWQRAYRRDFLFANNLFFVEDIRRAEDDLFSTMVMYHAQMLKTIPLDVYVYRVRDNSITTTVNVDRWYDSLKAQEMLVNFFVPKLDVDKSVIYRVLASNYINWFSIRTLQLYGNHDRELCNRINWNDFKQVCIAKRHKRLYAIIRISPALFRFYERIVK